MHQTEYYTPAEVAARLKLSTDTIIRVFEKRAGVFILGKEESRYRRRYRTIRISHQALMRFEQERCAR